MNTLHFLRRFLTGLTLLHFGTARNTTGDSGTLPASSAIPTTLPAPLGYHELTRDTAYDLLAALPDSSWAGVHALYLALASTLTERLRLDAERGEDGPHSGPDVILLSLLARLIAAEGLSTLPAPFIPAHVTLTPGERWAPVTFDRPLTLAELRAHGAALGVTTQEVPS